MKINILILSLFILSFLFIVLFHIKHFEYFYNFKPKRKNLLFSSIGKRESDIQAIDLWTKDLNRNFDIALYYYNSDVPKNCYDYCLRRNGTKFQNFYHFASNNDLSQYDAIWIVDDDIQIETKNINKMFDIFHEYNLDLAQPAFTENSAISHIITKKKPDSIIRKTNFIENGVVIISKKALLKCLPVFKNAISGWGVDYILSNFIDNRNNIAVIDNVACYHPKIKSSLDNFLVRNEHPVEGSNLMKKFNVNSFEIKEY